MPRPTRSEIDAEIIDSAAGLFARHGFAHTSLQQIADAVNYSKAGLLHHYPSKQAIYDAALKTVGESIRTVFADVEKMPLGIERERAVIVASVDFTFDWPGVSALGNRLAEENENVDPELTQMGFIVYSALGTDLATADQERIVRVTSAFSGIGATVLIAARLGLKQQWREHIITTAMNALGHNTGD